ncbi:MAG TPA: bifunctional DNA-binding transcriptional regulator/O6-methylguanine-DNA methyltransferase Ada [Gammaproteobacteria bacterium]
MITETEMRDAIRRRDAAYEGRFVYAVVTTGVYCRPSCAARPARPENLRFFADAKAAADAGFRPCKRCLPDEASPRLPDLVATARYIEAHSGERLGLDHLAARAGLSPSRFRHVFKAAFGVSPKAYQDAVRMRELKAALKREQDVTGAIYAAGFGSSSRLYEVPARHIGMTPSAYRAGGAGERIVYACRDTALGAVLLGATERGVCFAEFGDDERSLRERLRSEFPRASLEPAPGAESPELDAWLDALVEHVEAGGPRPDLPLDLRGTAFQIKVWRFLLQIPDGSAMSYGEVAAGIGAPRAARAVARACAANRVAVLVPCHRVLRGDGGIGGYRWGTHRKRALLDGERRRRSGST